MGAPPEDGARLRVGRAAGEARRRSSCRPCSSRESRRARRTTTLGAAAAYLRAAKEFPKDPRAAQACVNAELEAQKAGDIATLKEAAPARDGQGVPRPAPSRRSARGRRRRRSRRWGCSATPRSSTRRSRRSTTGSTRTTRSTSTRRTRRTTRSSCATRRRARPRRRSTATSSSHDFPNAAEADEVVFQMGKADQNAGRDKQAAELYRRYLPRAKNARPPRRGLRRCSRSRDDRRSATSKGADESLAEAVEPRQAPRAASSAPDGKYAAAHARYMEGERVLARFDEIQISGRREAARRRG